VRQGHGEARVSPARRLDAEALPQPLERRVEGIERRRARREAAVLVPRAVALLDSRQVEERLGKLVVPGALAAGDLLPGALPIRDVVAEADLARTERVENPARAAFDRRGDQRRTLLRSRATCTSAGLRSSRASTAST
jgi:hypothetical protein